MHYKQKKKKYHKKTITKYRLVVSRWKFFSLAVEGYQLDISWDHL